MSDYYDQQDDDTDDQSNALEQVIEQAVAAALAEVPGGDTLNRDQIASRARLMAQRASSGQSQDQSAAVARGVASVEALGDEATFDEVVAALALGGLEVRTGYARKGRG